MKPRGGGALGTIYFHLALWRFDCWPFEVRRTYTSPPIPLRPRRVTGTSVILYERAKSLYEMKGTITAAAAGCQGIIYIIMCYV